MEPVSFAGTGYLWLDCAVCRQLTGFWVGDPEGLAKFHKQGRRCGDCMGVRVDSEKQRVYVDGKEVHLQPKEYELLSVLMERPGVPLHRDRLLLRLWGHYLDGVEEGVLYNTIWKIRQKLGHQYIQTRHKKGWCFIP